MMPVPRAEVVPIRIMRSSYVTKVVVTAYVLSWFLREPPNRRVTRADEIDGITAHRASYAVLRLFERRPRYCSKGRPTFRTTIRETAETEGFIE